MPGRVLIFVNSSHHNLLLRAFGGAASGWKKARLRAEHPEAQKELTPEVGKKPHTLYL